MKEFKNVQGSMDTVKEVEFNVDTIYVRSNVVRLDDVWQYDEIQYTYQEWAELNSNKISILTEKQEATTVAITSVEKDQIVQDIDIKDNMLACVELCDMVLALMDTQPQIFNTKGVINHMAKIYAKLIIEGDITIEDVPSRYRIEVERLLAVMDK